jgi:hypothetical protein
MPTRDYRKRLERIESRLRTTADKVVAVNITGGKVVIGAHGRAVVHGGVVDRVLYASQGWQRPAGPIGLAELPEVCKVWAGINPDRI